MTKPTKCVCAQRRLRSALASPQSDQCLRYALNGKLRTQGFSMRKAMTLIRLGRPVWSEFTLCAQWEAKDTRFLHAESEDSDLTMRMPRLIWVFAGRTTTLLVLSFRGSRITIVCYHMSRDMTKPTMRLCAQRRLRSAWASASLFRVLAVRMKKQWVLIYPLSAHRSSDQIGRMPRLPSLFAERTVILLVSSCRGSHQTYNQAFSFLFHVVYIVQRWTSRNGNILFVSL